mmetsp:Transcript_26890/g.58691  ORF Transcript_26890/g.58691 Transcript_26890/m.58691 type:complete len:348 (+) Transcript_26890:33-1076(+)
MSLALCLQAASRATQLLSSGSTLNCGRFIASQGRSLAAWMQASTSDALEGLQSRAASSLATTSQPSTSFSQSHFALAPRPGPLTVAYPFPLQYLKDREGVVYDLQKRPRGVEKLEGAVFNVPVRVDILHRVVRYLRAKWQQGTHKTKRKSEVSGGGKKPRPQKKTGRSRQGSIRSPLWKGGGTTFGPVPRSHAHKLPINVQRLGMKCALSAKCNEGRLVIVDSLALEPGTPLKTKEMVQRLDSLMAGVPGSTALLVDSGPRSVDGGPVLRRVARNIDSVDVMAVEDMTVYHMLKRHALIITKPALDQLVSSLTEPQTPRKKPLRAAWWQRQQAAFDQATADLLAAET